MLLKVLGAPPKLAGLSRGLAAAPSGGTGAFAQNPHSSACTSPLKRGTAPLEKQTYLQAQLVSPACLPRRGAICVVPSRSIEVEVCQSMRTRLQT